MMSDSAQLASRPLWTGTKRASLVATATVIAHFVRNAGPDRVHLLGEELVFGIQFAAIAVAGVSVLVNRYDEGTGRDRYGDSHGSLAVTALTFVWLCSAIGSLALIAPWRQTTAGKAWSLIVGIWMSMSPFVLGAVCVTVYEALIGLLDDKRKSRCLASIGGIALLFGFLFYRLADVKLPSFEAIKNDRCLYPSIR